MAHVLGMESDGKGMYDVLSDVPGSSWEDSYRRVNPAAHGPVLCWWREGMGGSEQRAWDGSV